VIEFLLPNKKPSSTSAESKTTLRSMQQLHIFGNFVLHVSIMERRTSLPVVVSRLMLPSLSHPCVIFAWIGGLAWFVYICIHFLGGNDFLYIYMIFVETIYN
jgi:hypothetical protein